jgi:drug/metabolite transporter (DMT)-like permease
MPLGPRPLPFVGLMLLIGLLASWLGTLCWNEASQRLPTTLLGQLIVFETLSALAYSFALRGQWPAPVTLLGVALLVAGVMLALRVKAAPLAAEMPAH